MTGMAATFLVPTPLTTAALQAVNATAGVHGSLQRFATQARLDAIPGEIEAAIERLNALQLQLARFREEQGLPPLSNPQD